MAPLRKQKYRSWRKYVQCMYDKGLATILHKESLQFNNMKANNTKQAKDLKKCLPRENIQKAKAYIK